MKDRFSDHSTEYARFRPGYPAQLFDFLPALCVRHTRAWDCATGNGQIAAGLAAHFEQIEATDISGNQLRHAVQKVNIRYRAEAAETPSFPDRYFDLIVVGQAAHWFDFDKFYAAVRRVAHPGAVLALVGYNLLTVDVATDALIRHLYSHVLGTYWDAERRHVEAAYSTIPFPFPEKTFPVMDMAYEWTADQLLGYLSTWSALRLYVEKTGASPLSGEFRKNVQEVWPDGVLKTVRFPIFGRIGVVNP